MSDDDDYDRDFDSVYEERAWDSLPDWARDDEWVETMHHMIFDDNISGDMRSNAFDAIEEYIRDTYGVEWDDIFDWEDFRDWYDAA